MAKRKLILALAKLIIAAAWADGELQHEEIVNLKSLLLRLRTTGYGDAADLTGQEWALLEMYMQSPVEPAERERLLVDLQANLRTRRQRRDAIAAVRDVVAADGVVTPEEQVVLEQIESALNATGVGLGGALTGLVSGRIRQRRAEVASAPNRERFFDDYLRNRVFYALRRHLETENVTLDLTEPEQRKLGLAGGLMARVAHVDGTASPDEFRSMVRTIQACWPLADDAAAFVAEVALQTTDDTVEVTRLTKQLASAATVEERREILTALFAVAAADGAISLEEHEEIRIMARGLKLIHPDFVAAKQKGRELAAQLSA